MQRPQVPTFFTVSSISQESNLAIVTQVSKQSHELLNGANSTHFQHFGDSRNYVCTFKKYFQKLIINSVLCFGEGLLQTNPMRSRTAFYSRNIQFVSFSFVHSLNTNNTASRRPEQCPTDYAPALPSAGARVGTARNVKKHRARQERKGHQVQSPHTHGNALQHWWEWSPPEAQRQGFFRGHPSCLWSRGDSSDTQL